MPVISPILALVHATAKQSKRSAIRGFMPNQVLLPFLTGPQTKRYILNLSSMSLGTEMLESDLSSIFSELLTVWAQCCNSFIT